MSIVISAYGQNAFCEFLLPAVNNTDTEILLKKSMFAFPQDLILRLEVVEKAWYIKSTEEYTVTKQSGQENGPLVNGDILIVRDSCGNQVSLIVRETEASFSVFTKYDLTGIPGLTVGSENNNHIVYQYQSLVSRHHATLQRTAQGFCIQDASSNGTFYKRKEDFRHV